MEKLTLYVLDRCPYCNKVLDYIRDNDIKGIEIKEVGDSKNQAELMEIGGEDQVPMLSIDGKPLYESMDIIEYLKENCK